MNYLIVEDEINACEYLRDQLKRLRPKSVCLEHIDSVEETINWLHKEENNPEIIFMDIQLSDGISFEIFNHVEINCPIIFTTAYDQYAIKAFKVNGLDYLLKPIMPDQLEVALQKFDNLKNKQEEIQIKQLHKLVLDINREKKNRFLVKKGNHFEFINVDKIAFVHSEDSLTFLFTKEGKRHIYSKTISDIEEGLSSDKFFRINRGQIVNIDSISKIHPYLNQRLKIELSIPVDIELVVSRNKMMDFKTWVDS